MDIKTFGVEQWMGEYEIGAKYNIAETCVDSITLDQLFELTGENKEVFLEKICSRRLDYGDILGLPDFLDGICGLYKTLKPEEIMTTHGACGANFHAIYSLINPGDEVISIMPTYQQLYSIPESFGAKVHIVNLEKEDGYLPKTDLVKKFANEKTKIIFLNNPNNPTGALMTTEQLKDIIEVARSVGAYVFCDETYRHLNQEDIYAESIVDLYEKGISVSSMSKVFSMAGTRLGWIATHDKYAIEQFIIHRDYNMVSCPVLEEMIAALALKHADKLIGRSRNVVRGNLEILDKWIKSEPHVSYVKPQAGTTALVYYDYDMDSRTFCDRMWHETGAFVTPGECFEIENSVRIGYTCSEEVLKAGLKAFSDFMRIVEKEKEKC